MADHKGGLAAHRAITSAVDTVVVEGRADQAGERTGLTGFEPAAVSSLPAATRRAVTVARAWSWTGVVSWLHRRSRSVSPSVAAVATPVVIARAR